MKITQVEAIYLRQPQVKQQCDSGQDALIVRVSTDAGITGLGEVDSAPLAVKGAIEGPSSHTATCGLRELVRQARTGLGNDADLMIDAGLVWDAKTALQRARAFSEYDIFWLEEPLAPDDYLGYQKLCQATDVRIAAGEEESSRQSFLQLM